MRFDARTCAIDQTSKTSPLTKVLHAPGVLPTTGNIVSKETLIARITDSKICGRDRARKEIVPLLLDEGYLEQTEVPRPNARPEICFVRTDRIPGKVSFANVRAVPSNGVVTGRKAS